MKLDEFLQHYQYKRKIALKHYFFTKKYILLIAGLIVYMKYFQIEGKWSIAVYAFFVIFAIRGYIKTNLIFSDKINMFDNKNKFIWFYYLISTTKKKNLKRFKKEK